MSRKRREPDSLGTLFIEHEVRADPHGYYRELRRRAPVAWCEPLDAWLVSRYEDVLAGLRDERLSSGRGDLPLAGFPDPIRKRLRPLTRFFDMWPVFSTPDRHARRRAAIERIGALCRAEAGARLPDNAVAEQLEFMSGHGRVDLVQQFARPLAMRSTLCYLGLETRDMDAISNWLGSIVACLGSGSPTVSICDAALDAIEALQSHYQNQLLNRSDLAKGTVIGVLRDDEPLRCSLSAEERFAIVVNLLAAGYEPVANALTNSVAALLQRPSDWARCGDDEALETGVDELLRYESPFVYAGRVAMEELSICSRRIAAGSRVLLLLGSANRDDSRFEHADQLHLGRKPNPHLAFGSSTHYCSGAAGARTLLRAAIGELARRWPGMELAEQRLDWHPHLGIRSLARLAVQLNGSRTGNDQAAAEKPPGPPRP